LEIYSRSDDLKESPLTLFVRDLLRLDDLDALLDGLFDADDLRRAKNLVPALRLTDDLRREARKKRDGAVRNYDQLALALTEQFGELRRLAVHLALDIPSAASLIDSDLVTLKTRLSADSEEGALVEILKRRRELESLAAAWADL